MEPNTLTVAELALLIDLLEGQGGQGIAYLTHVAPIVASAHAKLVAAAPEAELAAAREARVKALGRRGQGR